MRHACRHARAGIVLIVEHHGMMKSGTITMKPRGIKHADDGCSTSDDRQVPLVLKGHCPVAPCTTSGARRELHALCGRATQALVVRQKTSPECRKRARSRPFYDKNKHIVRHGRRPRSPRNYGVPWLAFRQK